MRKNHVYSSSRSTGIQAINAKEKRKHYAMIDRKLNYGRRHVKRLAEIAFSNGLARDAKILDLGAGFGDDLLSLRRLSSRFELLAIENAPACIEKLTSLNIKHYPINIELEKIPLADESLDFLITNQVLEHMKDVFWIFHEMTRVLKIGGYLLVGVPNLASLHNRILLLFGRQPSPIKTYSAHVRGFTKGDLRRFVEAGFPNGFEHLKAVGSNFYPFPGWLAKPLAMVWPTGAWSIFLLMRKSRRYRESFLEFPIKERLETRFYLGPERGYSL
jgi:SAM-dependent methyltransferase